MREMYLSQNEPNLLLVINESDSSLSSWFKGPLKIQALLILVPEAIVQATVKRSYLKVVLSAHLLQYNR